MHPNAQSSSPTPSTIAATAVSEGNKDSHTTGPRYEELPSLPTKIKDDCEAKLGSGGAGGGYDYMTLKADDVEKSKNEGRILVGKSKTTEFNKPISGLAQPGPQTPNNNDTSQTNTKTQSNANEDDESGIVSSFTYTA